MNLLSFGREFLFTVNSIGIKSMSVAYNKFSLWNFFSFSFLFFKTSSSPHFFQCFQFFHYAISLSYHLSFGFIQLFHFFHFDPYFRIFFFFPNAQFSFQLMNWHLFSLSLSQHLVASNTWMCIWSRRAAGVLTERSLEKPIYSAN